MKSLTPDETIQRLGWKEARQSLKDTRHISAPMSPSLPRFYWKHPHTYWQYSCYLWVWLKAWAGWPWRTVKFWKTVWDHSRTNYVKEYKALAKTGMDSRQIFRQTKRKMHLTEDQIFEQGNKILRGEGLPPFSRPKKLK